MPALVGAWLCMGLRGWLEGSSMADCKDVPSRGTAAILALHLQRTVCGGCHFVLTAPCKPLFKRGWLK